MDRDPTNWECTRDPIFLLQVGYRKWTGLPSGVVDGDDGELLVEDSFVLEGWIIPFIEHGIVSQTEAFWEAAENQENDHGFPLVYTEWRTESVFLTRAEGESFAKSREYRYQLWRVYCIPCEGELAKILREYETRSESLGASVWQSCDTCRDMTQQLFISACLVQCQECLEITKRVGIDEVQV